MEKYHKIQWVYNYNEKTHKPIKTIVEELQPIKDIERLFTEKIDWTNVRVYRDWHKTQFFWRTEKSQMPVVLLHKLESIFKEELLEQQFWDTEVVLFWEWYWGKIQCWKRDYKEEEDFILFDVKIGYTYLQRDSINEIAVWLWLDFVPTVLKWTLQDGIDRVENNCMWKDKNEKQIEWIVGTPTWWYLDRMWRRIVVKIKQDHLW